MTQELDTEPDAGIRAADAGQGVNTTVTRFPIERRIAPGTVVVHAPTGRRGVLTGHGRHHARVHYQGDTLCWPWEQVQRSHATYTDPEPAA